MLFIQRPVIRMPQFLRYLSPDQQKILFVLAFLLLALHFFKFYFHPPRSPQEIYTEGVMEVSGDVQNPGVYLFKTAPTLKEAIDRAGGFNEAVLWDEVSSSELLETGTLVNVAKASPNEVKISLGRMEANKLLIFSIPLDLNRASVGDLCLIPGIGESLAREIVSYRERRKGFRSVEELKQ